MTDGLHICDVLRMATKAGGAEWTGFQLFIKSWNLYQRKKALQTKQKYSQTSKKCGILTLSVFLSHIYFTIPSTRTLAEVNCWKGRIQTWGQQNTYNTNISASTQAFYCRLRLDFFPQYLLRFVLLLNK